MTKDLQDEIKTGAVYRLTVCNPARAPEVYEKIVHLQKMGEKVGREVLAEYHRRAAITVEVVHNLSPTVGRTALAMRLAGDTTYTGTVTRVAIGNGTTAPANGDTVLDNETYRKAFDDTTFINNVAYLSAFIPAGTATGTHTEAGLFIDGTNTVDTGQIISRVLLSPQIVKSALVSLTIEAALTVS